MPESAVSVVVRIRPPLRHEVQHGLCTHVTEGRRIHLNTASPQDQRQQPTFEKGQQARGRDVECEYDQVLDVNASQDDTWAAVRPTIDRAIEGYNATVMTYGMTGSGKTHTMLGPTLMGAAFAGQELPTQEALRACSHRGLVPRVMEHVFLSLSGAARAAGESENAKVTMSYLQIYKEQCWDLLRPARASGPLKLRERGGVYLEGLTEVAVPDMQACLERLIYGFSNITFRSTHYNEQSSRSHSMLILSIQKPAGKAGVLRRSRVCLVDLAGNERWDTFGPEMTRAHERELSSINRSLHVLGQCVQALSKQTDAAGRDGGRGSHVPYRDSVLTMLLRESLSGNSFTTLLCTVCASPLYQVQSLCTLRFADRAKRVKMKAKLCEVADAKTSLQQSQAEIAYLRSLVAESGIKNDLQQRVDDLSKLTKDLEGENKSLKEQLLSLSLHAEKLSVHSHSLVNLAEGSADVVSSLDLTTARLAARQQRRLRRAHSEPAITEVHEGWDDGPESCGQDLKRTMGAYTGLDSVKSSQVRSVSALLHDSPPPPLKQAAAAAGPPATFSARSSAPPSPPLREEVQEERGPSDASGFATRLEDDVSDVIASVLQSNPKAPRLPPKIGCCPRGHILEALGSSLQPLGTAAYSEWHCDSGACMNGSVRTPSIGRFHCALCQHDLCQQCHADLVEPRSEMPRHTLARLEGSHGEMPRSAPAQQQPSKPRGRRTSRTAVPPRSGRPQQMSAPPPAAPARPVPRSPCPPQGPPSARAARGMGSVRRYQAEAARSQSTQRRLLNYYQHKSPKQEESYAPSAASLDSSRSLQWAHSSSSTTTPNTPEGMANHHQQAGIEAKPPYKAEVRLPEVERSAGAATSTRRRTPRTVEAAAHRLAGMERGPPAPAARGAAAEEAPVAATVAAPPTVAPPGALRTSSATPPSGPSPRAQHDSSSLSCPPPRRSPAEEVASAAAAPVPSTRSAAAAVACFASIGESTVGMRGLLGELDERRRKLGASLSGLAVPCS